MATTGKYTILSVRPTTYLDKQNQPIEGYRIDYNNVDFDEDDYVYSPTKKSRDVKPRIEQEVKERQELALLGS